MKKMLFIVNPMAGKSAYKNNFGEAMLVFDRAGIAPTVRFTSNAGDATELAKQAADYDIVGCVGGDGTLSEVMEGLVQLPKEDRRPIGYIPLGTANDVATTLGLPKNNIIAAAERIANGKPRYFDVGTFGDNGSFTYVAAFGAFTEVSYETPQQEKQGGRRQEGGQQDAPGTAGNGQAGVRLKAGGLLQLPQAEGAVAPQKGHAGPGILELLHVLLPLSPRRAAGDLISPYHTTRRRHCPRRKRAEAKKVRPPRRFPGPGGRFRRSPLAEGAGME